MLLSCRSTCSNEPVAPCPTLKQQLALQELARITGKGAVPGDWQLLDSDSATYEMRVSAATETTCVRTLDRQYIECLQHGGSWLELCDPSFNAYSE